MKEKYTVTLYYGYTENKYGIDHAFKAADPECTDYNKERAFVGDLLDIKAHEYWDFDFINFCIPGSVVDRIKEDAVREYLKNAER